MQTSCSAMVWNHPEYTLVDVCLCSHAVKVRRGRGSPTYRAVSTVCDVRALGAVPGKIRFFVDLGKVDAQVMLQAGSGNFQHPGCRIELPLNDGHPRYPLLTHQLYSMIFLSNCFISCEPSLLSGHATYCCYPFAFFFCTLPRKAKAQMIHHAQ